MSFALPVLLLVTLFVKTFIFPIPEGDSPDSKKPGEPEKAWTPPSSSRYLGQSPPAIAVNRPETDFGLGVHHVTKLAPYPPGIEGDRTPFDLWRYAGRGKSSWGSPVLSVPFSEWVERHREQKPTLMSDVRTYMESRYDFSAKPRPDATMTCGKPIPLGPAARLEKSIASFEALAELSPEEVLRRDVFPYKPLAHPLQTTAHMLFPEMWVTAHPEHLRMDVDFDIPDAYLPEFPPPLFLTTHKELGDVSKGREIMLGNYYEILCNHTEHRVTLEPSAGVSCFSCHVNGHSNGAIELAPDSRPNQARLRMDTPSMRGNYNMMQLSSKRSIRSMDHFAEVEEYFDGDTGLMQAIGPRSQQRQVTNRMGDFNSIIDFAPAPKLGPLMRLIRAKATPQELRGEGLFHGKAQCETCHYGPAFTDDYLHDLQVERFYAGRPEGPIKTFALRGIKDSPPYLHDGRCPTLEDAVEFFNLVLELRLTKEEKSDLVAYLLCL
jgi:hypothetical protein